MITCCPPTQPALEVCAHQLKQLWHFAPTNSSSCGTLRQPTHSTLPPCVNLRAHRSRSPKYAHCPHYSYHYEWCTPCTKDYATRTILLRRRAVQAQHLRHLWLCLPKRGASVGHFESPWRHLVQILMLSVHALGWLHLAPARLQRIVCVLFQPQLSGPDADCNCTCTKVTELSDSMLRVSDSDAKYTSCAGSGVSMSAPLARILGNHKYPTDMPCIHSRAPKCEHGRRRSSLT